MYNVFVYQKSGGKLAGGYVELGDDDEPVKKKRKVVSRMVRPALGSQFRAADTSSVKQVWSVGYKISRTNQGHSVAYCTYCHSSPAYNH